MPVDHRFDREFHLGERHALAEVLRCVAAREFAHEFSIGGFGE